MFIHACTAISPQQTFQELDLQILRPSVDNKLFAIEPAYPDIPAGSLRRIGKAVRLGIGSGLAVMKQASLIHGIILGTANGGMEDCIKFLNQIVDYNEGLLTPGNFVQSTPNAIAAQLSLIRSNKHYNITHMHRGLAFEMALLDVQMKLIEEPGHQFLVGGVDEISTYNHTIDLGAGWYKSESCSNQDLFLSNSAGSIAGEGAAMFLVNNIREGARAEIKAIETLHNPLDISTSFTEFMAKTSLQVSDIDCIILGKNGDKRLDHFYDDLIHYLPQDITVLGFKHMTGEFPTANALGLWLGVKVLEGVKIPEHMILRKGALRNRRNLLLYNQYHGKQHSFILIQLP